MSGVSVMSQFASFDPARLVLSQPTCPQCGPSSPINQTTMGVSLSARPARRWSAKSSSIADGHRRHFLVVQGVHHEIVAEYLADAIKFDRMAEDATDAALKASFRKQAAEYRKLALKRAKQIGMPPTDVSPEPKADEV